VGLVLASASPRRQTLLALIHSDFGIAATILPEVVPAELGPAEVVQALAAAKARAAMIVQPRGTLVAADTLVELDGFLLGKPLDASEARNMLMQLRGRWHTVWTGLAVMDGGQTDPDVRAVRTDVLMRKYSEIEIDEYVATGDPLDKAAAYAIQHATFHPVEAIQGCYANVMGLPLCELQGMRPRAFERTPGEIRVACQEYLSRACGFAFGCGLAF
jgi:MAF protein